MDKGTDERNQIINDSNRKSYIESYLPPVNF